MSDDIIDLFFSFRGRASRQQWVFGSLAIALAAALGVYLFNDGSFDESIYAQPEIPTMAAVIWVFVCLTAFWAVSVKRVADAGLSRWVAVAVCVLSLLLATGWACGVFPAAPSSSTVALAFWALAGLIAPGLVLCAIAGKES